MKSYSISTVLELILFVSLICLSCDDNTGPGDVSGEPPEASVLSLDITSWSYARVHWNFTLIPDEEFGSYRLYTSDSPGIQSDTSAAEMIYSITSKYFCAFKDSSVVPAGTPYYALLTTSAEGYTAWSNEIAVDVPNREPDSVAATVAVGAWPTGICCTPSGDYAYACCFGEKEIHVIRTSDNTLESIIELDYEPVAICCLNSGDYIYVTHYEGVLAIRTSDNTVTAEVSMPGEKFGICTVPSDEYIYVSNGYDGYVNVIRTADNTIACKIYTNGYPVGICSAPSGDYVYVADRDLCALLVIRTSDNSISAFVGIPSWFPVDLCSTLSGDFVYILSDMDPVLTVIETSGNTIVAEIDVEPGSDHICAHPTAEYLYLTNDNSNSVSVIRTSDNHVVERIETDYHLPDFICALPSGEAFYTGSWYTDKVVVIR